jgi:hypothetical protein
MIGCHGSPQGANRVLSVKAGYLNEFVEDLPLVGTRGGVIALRNCLYQFSFGCQTQLPPASVARHLDLRRVTFS